MKMISIFNPDGTKKKSITYGRYLWEKEHGPVPEGKGVVFLDGDTFNTEMSNLALMTRSEGGRHMMSRRTHDERMTAVARREEKQRRAKILRAYVEHKPYRFETQASFTPEKVTA